MYRHPSLCEVHGVYNAIRRASLDDSTVQGGVCVCAMIGRLGGGVLTPSVALGMPFVERLKAEGIQIDVKSASG
jgi:short subunit dehydrogenase-like uncharacterized protein